MKVIIADKAGACYGVERALKIVERAGEGEEKVRTLGPLIHNPQVVQSLEDKGIGVAHSVDEVNDGAIVIRSHGVPVSVEEALHDKGLEVVDATCPFVKKAHVSARKLAEQGYQVVIVGDKGHAEVEGIQSYAGDKVIVTTSTDDLKDIKHGKKVGMVVQTTQSQEVLNKLVTYLLPRVSELRVYNTICEATAERQAAADELASHVQAMIVVGGKNSGNTKRLYEICKDRCENTHHIETEAELDPAWFKGVDTVGVTAGASTPASMIATVVAALEAL